MPELPLIITTAGATITGADNGIYAINTGYRRTEHHNNGYDDGYDGDGIYAKTKALTSRLTRPPRRAVQWHLCENYGTGALSITTTGTTTGGNEMAFMRKTSGTGDLTINAADTTGGYNGI